MFIELPTSNHNSSLQRSETEARLAGHCRKHCALLERRSALVTDVYKHLAPLEPEPLFGCGEAVPRILSVLGVASSKVLVFLTKLMVIVAKRVPNGLHLESRGAISLTPWLQPGD